MSGLRYAEVSQREQKFLDVTSLTVEEFGQLVPAFEEAFQERMKEWCLDGKPRSGRPYTTYATCPLPTPEDRLLFILVYLKTNVLQVIQGELFGMPQNKANRNYSGTLTKPLYRRVQFSEGIKIYCDRLPIGPLAKRFDRF